MIEVKARLRGQSFAKQLQIGAMRTFAAEGNPELELTQQELAALKRELARIEGGWMALHPRLHAHFTSTSPARGREFQSTDNVTRVTCTRELSG